MYCSNSGVVIVWGILVTIASETLDLEINLERERYKQILENNALPSDRRRRLLLKMITNTRQVETTYLRQN